ncbi:MAG: UdgX family uracil-DNA binding protein [Actinomycetota bacterium]|nr:UdgX family uracil-DNA binding protein [Actinomycetota bacterium]
MPTRDRAEQPTAAPFVPSGADLDRLREAAAGCRGCHLHEQATQTVFGEGRTTARVVLVGEQPGDMEDRRGRPFVGPAGQLLDRALADAGVDRADAYVTNTVKHFKFTMASTGKRRIHAKPEALEINACRPWLDAELALLDPEVVVCLGATAAQALLGRSFRITKSRGALLPWPPEQPGLVRLDADAEDAGRKAAHVLATLHPSAVLRADDREAAYGGLVADLRVVARALG